MRRKGKGRRRVEPLWSRVERNRLRLGLFVAGFVVFAALAAELLVFLPLTAAVWLLHAHFLFTSLSPQVYALYPFTSGYLGSWWLAALLVATAGATVAAIYVLHALTRPLERQVASIGGAFVPPGDLLLTKHALKDMSIAAGIAPAPKLFAIDTSAVNAFVVDRGRERPVCVVTRGFFETLDPEEQRAVFANLIARLKAGDVRWATAVSALMSPLWRWRDSSLSANDSTLYPEDLSFLAADRSGPTYVSTLVRSPGAARGGAAVLIVGVWAFLTYALAVVASELVGAHHRQTHLLASEAADAEGMLLLKDPANMLRALRKAIEADNRLRMAVPMYAGLFYIWAGDDLADDDDPEWRRLDRLREIVGVDGMEDAGREPSPAGTAS